MINNASTGDGLRSVLMRAGSGALLIKLLNAALGFATTVVLARSMGPENLGVYAFAMAWIMVLALPVTSGIPQLVTRETASGHAVGDWDRVRGVWRWSTQAVLLLSAVLLVGFVAISFVLGDVISDTLLKTLAWGFALVPILGLALVRSSSLRGIGYTLKGQMPELLIKPPCLLVVLLSVWTLTHQGAQLQAPLVMALSVAASLAAFIAGALMLKRLKPSAVSAAIPKYNTVPWIWTIIPLAAINAMHLINTNADMLLIGIFMDNENVGVYKVAAAISLMMAFGLHAAKMFSEPLYARFNQQKDWERMQKFATTVSRMSGLIALMIFFPLLLFGEFFLLVVFGQQFVLAYVPLLILSGARVVSACIGSSGHLLAMTGFHKACAWFWVIAAAMNVALNLLLIPLYGLSGAALATAASIILANGLSWLSAIRWIGCDCSPIPVFANKEPHK